MAAKPRSAGAVTSQTLVVPSACHTGRSLAASGGHPRSLGLRWPALLLYRRGTTRMV